MIHLATSLLKRLWRLAPFLLVPALLDASFPAQAPTPGAAIALQQQGRLPEAESAWKAWLKLHPDDAPAFASLGVVLSREEKYAEAAAAYRKALALDPKLPGMQLNLGLAEFKRGD